jgi:hypothetical protein
MPRQSSMSSSPAAYLHSTHSMHDFKTMVARTTACACPLMQSARLGTPGRAGNGGRAGSPVHHAQPVAVGAPHNFHGDKRPLRCAQHLFPF